MNRTWQTVSDDPNSTAAKSQVIDALKRSRCKSGVVDRVEFLKAQVAGKDVLDVGVVEHTARAEEAGNWLHGHLAQSAKSILGIDILEKEVESLRAKGYNIVVHNIIEKPLEPNYDVAVCGDVLEHIDNPGTFIGNIAKSLKQGGRVFVSLPNPWYINYVAKSVLSRSQYIESADHVAWYDANTLVEMFGRQGLGLKSYRGVVLSSAGSLKAKLMVKIIPLFLLLGAKHELFSKTMIYEFVKY